MQCDAKTVPAKARENPSAQPFKRCPCRREQKGEPQVVCRSCPWRLHRGCCAPGLGQHLIPFVRGCQVYFASWPHQAAKPRPGRKINCHVKLKNEPTQDGDCREPGEYGPKKRQPGDVTQKQVSKPWTT